MNRTEFVIVTAVILMIAFALGWVAHLVLQRFTRIKGVDMSEVDRLASLLHDAEEARDRAMIYIEEREEQLFGQITQSAEELRSATQSLRDAQLEIEEMRAYIERLHANKR